MDGDVIKSFLVGLGFGVDEKDLAKFYKAIDSATTRVAALYGGINLAAAGIFAGVTKISAGFEEMGYQLRLVAPAINKFLILRQAMLDAYKKAGINITLAVKQSILFNYSLAKTKFALEAIYKSVAIKFIPMLTQQMEKFRAAVFANMPRIQEFLGGVIKVLFKAFGATVQLGTTVWHVLERMYEGLKQLDAVTGGWSTKILGFVAAWKLLNLGFLATPFGMVIAGITALIALYDDFKVWQEGGKSLIDWGSQTTKTIIGVVGVIAALTAGLYAGSVALGVLSTAMKVITVLQYAWDIAMAANPLGLIILGVTALIGLLGYLALKFGVFKSIGDWFSGVGGRILAALGGAGAAGVLAAAVGNASPNALGQVANPPPLVNHNNSNSQTITQKTDIVVQGAGDARAVGQAVAGEQGKVTADLTRNLRGAVRQ